MTPFAKAQQKRAYNRKKGGVVSAEMSLKTRVIIGACLLFSMITYVLLVNAVSVKGFAIFELEKNITALERENQRLQLHVAQLQSSDNLLQHIHRLGMTDQGETEYIVMQSEEVALR